MLTLAYGWNSSIPYGKAALISSQLVINCSILHMASETTFSELKKIPEFHFILLL